MKTTLGGDRLGSGNKQKIQMRNYERSTHDLSYAWRSSMASGTLVPFMSELALPGDSFDIDLACEVLTLPTIGPLFGSYKVQLDVFQCPIRLYNGKLHMNMLGIGMDMSQIKLPQIDVRATYDDTIPLDDNSQINPSCILSYLGIRGVGISTEPGQTTVKRMFNAVPYLSYWDIYKNYYANKQEERGFVIHNDMNTQNPFTITNAAIYGNDKLQAIVYVNATPLDLSLMANVSLIYILDEQEGQPNEKDAYIEVDTVPTLAINLFDSWRWEEEQKALIFEGYKGSAGSKTYNVAAGTIDNSSPISKPPQLVEFPLENIDGMRKAILSSVSDTTALVISSSSFAPYGLPLGTGNYAIGAWSKLSSQEGLAIKTYQSDLYNNWIDTEWIDGTNGVNEVTAISTVGDSFTIDALNLANKVYNMLNRIAISGGSYDDWLDAVYTHERTKSVESPIYHGSLIKELAFEEVISNSAATAEGTEQPLGTLAGRGRLTQKNKGGRIKIKIDEPSYIMGIVSLTPRIDYSQGNKWDMRLETMNDLHKPALDEIGFQDLITDQMAWFDTTLDVLDTVSYGSAGKQPAWINYMTNVNRTYGNFADQNKEMFMTLNRRYEAGQYGGIQDLTTYVDPSKFNHIFAQTNLDAQNFWVQIGVGLTARRKMSAKIIPNL